MIWYKMNYLKVGPGDDTFNRATNQETRHMTLVTSDMPRFFSQLMDINSFSKVAHTNMEIMQIHILPARRY